MIGCGAPPSGTVGNQEASKPAAVPPPASSQTPGDAVPAAPAPGRPEQLASSEKAGLYNADGTPHALHTDNPVTGKTLKVTDFGANPADNEQDDTPAINAAIKAAKRGDEVLLPNGVYNLNSALSTDRATHIELRSGINLRGESKEGVVLVSSFDGKSGTNTRVMKALAQDSIVISNLTVSSAFKGKYPTDTTKNNADRGGPVTGIYIENSSTKGSFNITVDNVILEKYQRMGVRVSKSRDVTIRNSLFRNATDLGGGGAGYGVVFQGTPKVDRKGQDDDSLFNVVESCRFEGPYIRHGALIQYYSHNNAVRNNVFSGTALDAIDLHGEMEYLNEVYNNTIENIAGGGGIGLGNTGGTAPTNHSASGPYNYIHDNVISGSRNGITVTMGSPKSIIENNTIKGSKIKNGTGITVMNGPDTIIRGNKITDNTGDGFWGILLQHDPGDRNAGSIGEGDPARVQITGNTIIGNTNGIKITHGSDITLKDNIVQNNKGADQIAPSALAK
jgi:parallel beta-helix repeat protein